MSGCSGVSVLFVVFMVNQTNVFAGARPNGLHVIVWNKDGSVLDFKVFKEIRETQDFFTSMYKQRVFQHDIFFMFRPCSCFG